MSWRATPVSLSAPNGVSMLTIPAFSLFKTLERDDDRINLAATGCLQDGDRHDGSTPTIAGGAILDNGDTGIVSAASSAANEETF